MLSVITFSKRNVRIVFHNSKLFDLLLESHLIFCVYEMCGLCIHLLAELNEQTQVQDMYFNVVDNFNNIRQHADYLNSGNIFQ